MTKYELEFYLEDGKTTTTDNRTFEIKKDHILIAKPGQIRHSELPFRTAYVKFTADGDIAKKDAVHSKYNLTLEEVRALSE